MDIVVRLADRDSATELTALHRAAGHTGFAHIFPPDAPPPTFAEDLARWEHWLGAEWDQGRRAHVAAVDAHTVGVVLTGPDPNEPGAGHLSRLYVHPTRWGQGIGTRLHAAALRDLTGRGFPEATLWVLERNHRARRWYERLGWVQSEKRTTTYAPAGIDDVQYRLALRGTPVGSPRWPTDRSCCSSPASPEQGSRHLPSASLPTSAPRCSAGTG